MNNMEVSDREPMIPDYREKILEILQEFEVEVPERAIQVACTLLEKVYKAHSDPNSESYKPYHNDQHALNVIRRSFRLWKLWREIAPEKIDYQGFELLLIAGAGHDLVVHSGKEIGYDEQESGYMASVEMNSAGYEKTQIERVFGAIITTTVERDKEGHVIQTFIRDGEKDPLRLALATADTNGTTMDGIDTMVDDGTKLYAEIAGGLPDDPIERIKGLVGFFGTQLQFVSDRIHMFKGDLEHYFGPELAKEIYSAHEQEFTGASRDVLSLAKTIESFPEMAKSAIEKALTPVTSLGRAALSEVALNLKEIFKRKK